MQPTINHALGVFHVMCYINVRYLLTYATDCNTSTLLVVLWHCCLNVRKGSWLAKTLIVINETFGITG